MEPDQEKTALFSLNLKILLKISFGSLENGENAVSILGNFHKFALDLRYLVKIGFGSEESRKAKITLNKSTSTKI